MENTNYGNNFGIIGGCFNTVNYNIKLSEDGRIFGNMSSHKSHMTPGTWNIMLVCLFDKYCTPIFEQLDRYIREGCFPAKIRITDLVDECAQTIYHNNGNSEEYLWEAVTAIIVLICKGTKYNFTGKYIRVNNHYYCELSMSK